MKYEVCLKVLLIYFASMKPNQTPLTQMHNFILKNINFRHFVEIETNMAEKRFVRNGVITKKIESLEGKRVRRLLSLRKSEVTISKSEVTISKKKLCITFAYRPPQNDNKVISSINVIILLLWETQTLTYVTKEKAIIIVWQIFVTLFLWKI